MENLLCVIDVFSSNIKVITFKFLKLFGKFIKLFLDKSPLILILPKSLGKYLSFVSDNYKSQPISILQKLDGK